tara:strand:- start:61 stop:276 length:216 start_codon:yes stop_codon:yes gene_type:complete
MDKEFYRGMLLLINSLDQYQSLQGYAETRINNLLTQLSTERDMDNIIRIQGAIFELKRFSTLREEVLKGAE